MKTVLIVAATGIVDNVIKLAAGTPYDPAPGISMIQVQDSLSVSPGQRLIDGSSPPAFEDVPAADLGDLPNTIPEAVAAVEASRAEVSAAQAKLDSAIDNLNQVATG
jgi:hypothetical protein